MMRSNRWFPFAPAVLLAVGCTETSTMPSPDMDPAFSHGVSYLAGTDIRAPGDHVINGARWTAVFPFGTGTGVLDPFLTLQANGSQEAFNTDASPLPLDAKRPQFTDALPLNNVPVISEDGGTWLEFILDANEPKSGTGPQFSIDVLDMWLCNDPAAPGYTQRSDFEANASCTLVYDIGGHDALLATSANTSGSGNTLDYRILIPSSNFPADALGACQYNPIAPDCGYYIVLYTHMGGVGGAYVTEATFEEFSTIRRGFLTVDKTANTSLTRTTTRTWTWTIEKTADQTQIGPITPNQAVDINYTVTLDANSNDVVVDSDWAVSGAITISNPSSDAVSIASVQDVISHAVDPDLDATVICPGGFPQTVNPGQTLVCTYSAALPNGDPRVNRASVELSDQATVVSALVPVDFASATITDVFFEIDECVDVNDVVEINGVVIPGLSQVFGQYCAASGLPKKFEYTHTITPDMLECEENVVDNEATFTTNDTGTQDSDDWSVDIFVLCEEGCTLTQGYWKTHNASFRGGASKKADPTWQQLPDAENTIFFLSGQSYFDVLWTNPAGNQYYVLAHQYIAAQLNTLMDPPAQMPQAVQDAFDEATNLFAAWTPAQIGALRGNNPTRQAFAALVKILDDFNNGVAGPGHCDESASP